ncbi:hypothetical protein AB0H97_17185 [Streptomyces sp. NPDC050788]
MTLLNPLPEVLIGNLLDYCQQLLPSSFVAVTFIEQQIAVNGSSEHFA